MHACRVLTILENKIPQNSRFSRPSKQFFQTTIKCKHNLTNHISSQFGSFLAQLQYFTRSSSHLHLLRVNTSYGSRCIKFKASQLWNTIPEELKLINKFNSFKNHLKSHLFNDIKYYTIRYDRRV